MTNLGRTNMLAALIGLAMVAAGCGGGSAPALPPSGAAPASSSLSASPTASTVPSASSVAKPAASASAAPKPAGSAAASGAAQAVAPKAGVINIAVVGGSPSFTPVWIGVDNGLFDKYGAPVNLITTTAPPAMAALINGDVQVAMDGGAMVGADTTGTKLVFIGALQNAFNQFVVSAKPGITSLAGLKGKTVGAASPGSAATIAFEIMLKSAGVNKTDVKWVYLGTPAAQYTALANGQIDAGDNAWPWYLMARQHGFVELADAKQLKIPGASLTLGASRQWVTANPNLVDGFLKALTESVHIANNDKAKAEASITKHLDVTDQVQLDDAFGRYAGTFPEPPYITKEAAQEAINDEPNPAVQQRKPEDYIVNAPLDRLVASGFTKQFGNS